MRSTRILAAAALLALAACSSSSDEPRRRATASLDPRSGSAVTGHADFVERDRGVEVTVTIAGATPGRHGVHIHQIGDCSDEKAERAGAHWNPDDHPHAGPGAVRRHAGDLGNIEVGADGRGTLTVVAPGLTVRPSTHAVVGHALVVHARPDDLASQPAGSSGPRIACGVIAIRLK
jgi:Cu-Zn family superoxide dismutase